VPRTQEVNLRLKVIPCATFRVSGGIHFAVFGCNFPELKQQTAKLLF
jgi:hypothetical protein